MTALLGTFTDRHTLRFELHYPHPPSAVWQAITDPEQLAVWFMPMTIEPRVDGRVTLEYGNDHGKIPAEGVITAFEPESLLEYRFDKGPWDWPECVLRFELEPEPGGSVLMFSQRIAPDTVWWADSEGQVGGPGTIHPGACAGWQGFFEEGLRRFLDGRPAPIYDAEDDELMATREQQYVALLERLP